MSDTEAPRRRILHGRRQGPKLRANDRARLETMLPNLTLALPEAGKRLDAAQLLVPGTSSLRLEVGFGGGEHLVAQAAAHPEITHLGVEPYINGVASTLRKIEEQGLGNVRILVDDARLLLESLEDDCLDRIAVLFPDPWPKARHKKRRIVNARTTAAFARLIAVGGELRLATDDSDYATWMLEAVRGEPRLAWTASRASDWLVRPDDWPATRYEAKAIDAGRKPVFLRFARTAVPSSCNPGSGSPYL